MAAALAIAANANNGSNITMIVGTYTNNGSNCQSIIRDIVQ